MPECNHCVGYMDSDADGVWLVWAHMVDQHDEFVAFRFCPDCGARLLNPSSDIIPPADGAS